MSSIAYLEERVDALDQKIAKLELKLERKNEELQKQSVTGEANDESEFFDDQLRRDLHHVVKRVKDTIPMQCDDETFKNAMQVSLKKMGYGVVQDRMLRVMYDGVHVGDVTCGLIVSKGRLSRAVEVKNTEKNGEANQNQARCSARMLGHAFAFLVNVGTFVDSVRRVDV